MASVKVASLVIRTLAKPIANSIKAQATEHETFRNICIGIAQRMHRSEARLRLGLLNEEAKNVKPLNDVKAVQNGANFIAESFLFTVAIGLLAGEQWRSSRKEKNRRDDVKERLDALEEENKQYREEREGVGTSYQQELEAQRVHIAQLETVLSTVVNNGLKAGWLALGHGHGQADTSESSILPLLDPPRNPASSNPPIPDPGAERDFQQSAVLSALASSRSSKTDRDEL